MLGVRWIQNFEYVPYDDIIFLGNILLCLMERLKPHLCTN